MERGADDTCRGKNERLRGRLRAARHKSVTDGRKDTWGSVDGVPYSERKVQYRGSVLSRRWSQPAATRHDGR
jgi:hypothetical protein